MEDTRKVRPSSPFGASMASSQAWRSFSAAGRKSLPRSVSSTCRCPLPRSSSTQSSSRSNAFRWRLTAGWVMYSAWAAAETFPVRTTARNTSISCKVMVSPF